MFIDEKKILDWKEISYDFSYFECTILRFSLSTLYIILKVHFYENVDINFIFTFPDFSQGGGAG